METQLEKTLQGNEDLSKRAQDAVGFHVFSQKKKKKVGREKTRIVTRRTQAERSAG